MAGFADCVSRIVAAAGRALSDDEIAAIYDRVQKAALDIKAGRVAPEDIGLGKLGKSVGVGESMDSLVQAAADRAAKDLVNEAMQRERRANLQAASIGARLSEAKAAAANSWRGWMGLGKTVELGDLGAVSMLIRRDFSGRTNIESLEQRTMGRRAELYQKLSPLWDALGRDFMGVFQDRGKVLDLIKELRGEDSGNALAKKGAAAFHEVAEYARTTFNSFGGDVGKLNDWGMPQHHSQSKVSAAGRDAWVEQILPLLDRTRYVDDLGRAYSDADMRRFLGHAWTTIATDGVSNMDPAKYSGSGTIAGRHAESRQIHFKDADSVLKYWNDFGDRTALEILTHHLDEMAKDIAFVEKFGPNPDVTYRVLRDEALRNTVMANQTDKAAQDAATVQAKRLDTLWDTATGRATLVFDRNLSNVFDGVSHLNSAGKLGGAMWASLFGDRVTHMALSHLNDIPVMKAWGESLRLLNPMTDRVLLEQNGLLADAARSALGRFSDFMGDGTPSGKFSAFTGKMAGLVLKVTGMNAMNEMPRAAFGELLFDTIGRQLKKGTDFSDLDSGDVRLLKNYGIQATDWKLWKLAKLETLGPFAQNSLTPHAVRMIRDAEIVKAGLVAQTAGAADIAAFRNDSIVRLLGAVNTEGEFAIVQPGWHERAQMYGHLERGTWKGEIGRSMYQFKAFPWAMFKRGMDLIANAETPMSKALMASYLVTATTAAGAMIMQTRDLLSGKDPRHMADENWYKFWGTAFLQGGALGIYGDFLYSINQTRYGTGPLEVMAGPTIGPALELMTAAATSAKNASEGKQTHYAATVVRDMKGFVPGGNMWMTKTVLDKLVWERVLDQLSPGYLATIRQSSMKDYRQQRWWDLGQALPERAPDFSEALK